MDKKVANIYIGASSIHTCLGNKSQTLLAMQSGISGLHYSNRYSMYAGLIDIKPIDGFSRFESLIIEEIDNIVKQSGVSINDTNTQIILSTTKGNIEFLANDCENISDDVFLYNSAKKISKYFQAKNPPIVVSNACISGVSALIIAKRMIQAGKCKHAVVVGCDVLSDFITAGFSSFKSISSTPCRPYDSERDGLSLGEAVAAVLLTSEKKYADNRNIRLIGGAISNDANHISGSSRTGDGLYYAICNAMSEAQICPNDIGFINTHGTATLFNDEMESKAVFWAGLSDKPLNSLKGYIGHTLGASGVVETILCVEQLKQGYIYGTAGFSSQGTSCQLKISDTQQPITHNCCVKTASGFGGCNAAIVLCMDSRNVIVDMHKREAKITGEYSLPKSDMPFAEFIRKEFRDLGESNMKFYKMSDMSKALYVAVANLLKTNDLCDIATTRCAIVLANKSSSLDADIIHQQILNQHLPEGASPATFVYTLANVAAGEICIRHKIQGENTFFIENEESGFVEKYAQEIIERNYADAVIYGWCDYLKENWNINIKLLKVK